MGGRALLCSAWGQFQAVWCEVWGVKIHFKCFPGSPLEVLGGGELRDLQGPVQNEIVACFVQNVGQSIITREIRGSLFLPGAGS